MSWDPFVGGFSDVFWFGNQMLVFGVKKYKIVKYVGKKINMDLILFILKFYKILKKISYFNLK